MGSIILIVLVFWNLKIVLFLLQRTRYLLCSSFALGSRLTSRCSRVWKPPIFMCSCWYFTLSFDEGRFSNRLSFVVRRATRRLDEMKERWEIISTSIVHTRWTMSLWVVAIIGCKVIVKKLILKGNCEVRYRPPRSSAWLRDSMVSSNKASFNLRERSPLSQILYKAYANGTVNGLNRVTETG